MKLRLGLSQRILAFLFDIWNASVVSDCMRDVLVALKAGFVDRHVGYRHITRELLQERHMSRYFSRVLELPEDSLVTILDGTYLYLEVNTQCMFYNRKLSYYVCYHSRNRLTSNSSPWHIPSTSIFIFIQVGFSTTQIEMSQTTENKFLASQKQFIFMHVRPDFVFVPGFWNWYKPKGPFKGHHIILRAYSFASRK